MHSLFFTKDSKISLQMYELITQKEYSLVLIHEQSFFNAYLIIFDNFAVTKNEIKHDMINRINTLSFLWTC